MFVTRTGCSTCTSAGTTSRQPYGPTTRVWAFSWHDWPLDCSHSIATGTREFRRTPLRFSLPSIRAPANSLFGVLCGIEEPLGPLQDPAYATACAWAVAGSRPAAAGCGDCHYSC